MRHQAKSTNSLRLVYLLFMLVVPLYTGFSYSKQPTLAQGTPTELWRRLFPNSDAPSEQSIRSSEPEGNPGEAGDERGDDDDDQVCAIAPNYSGTLQVWNDKPTLTWIGKVTQVEIREFDGKDALWSQKIPATDQVTLNLPTPLTLQQVTVAAPLQPGQTYNWYISDKSSGVYGNYFPVEFKLMTAQERAVITQELQQLEQEWATQDLTGDVAKLRRADYFASQELWLDFWQEVLSVQSPSEELKDLLSSTADELCQ